MMRGQLKGVMGCVLLLLLTVGVVGCASPLPKAVPGPDDGAIRVATWNVALSGRTPQDMVGELRDAQDEKVARLIDVLGAVSPDVVLLQEVDHDPSGVVEALLLERLAGLGYTHAYSPPVNTGVSTGVDVDGDGTLGPGDAQGYAVYEGQYGMVVLSRYPIEVERVRDFRELRWQDMPGNRMPTDWYTPQAQAVQWLSSKTHAIVPVDVDGQALHLLISHPTPPVFDGPEDRNGRRNHDEIRLWADVLTGGAADDYLGFERDVLPPGARFVLMGDMNADPNDGDSVDQAIQQLLEHPRVQDVQPRSVGAMDASRSAGGINLTHQGDPALDTGDFGDPPGKLRIDYVLPSTSLTVTGAGVYWLEPDHPDAMLNQTSDHHLVWVDVVVGW